MRKLGRPSAFTWISWIVVLIIAIFVTKNIRENRQNNEEAAVQPDSKVVEVESQGK